MSDSEKNEYELSEELSDNVQPEKAAEDSSPAEPADEIQPEETNESEAVTENAEQGELYEELEGIRSKFQEILDETAQTYLAGGDIQGFEEDAEEAQESEEISEDELCECCGEKRRDTSLGEDYPYCSECRELMQHYPFSFLGVLALICIVVLTGVSVFLFGSSNAEIAIKSLEADEYAMQGKIYSALDAYNKTLQQFSSSSVAVSTTAMPKKVVARYAGAYASMLNYYYAGTVIDQFFSESDLKNPAFRSLNEYKKLNECYSAIMETINTSLEAGTDNPDDISELLDDIRSREYADDFLIEYYKYIVLQYFGETAQNQFDILTALSEKYPDKWPVKYELCAISAKLGKTDEAEKNLKEVIKHNSEDGAIYAYLADAYRFCEEPDPDKMLEALAEGEKADGEAAYSSTDLNRVKAIAYLLKGDYDTAYDCASEAYKTASSSLYYGYSVNNLSQCLYTYQLCAHLKEDRDAYDSVTAILGYVGLEESKQLKKFVKGNGTLEDLITDGEGDLA